MKNVTRHESFSVSVEKNRGERPDFVYENSNKTTINLFYQQEYQQLKIVEESVGKLQI